MSEEYSQVFACVLTEKQDRNGNYYLIGTIGQMRVFAPMISEDKNGNPRFNMFLSPVPEKKEYDDEGA